MTQVKEIIFKTTIQTLFIATIVFSYALGIFAFAVPKPMANFYDMIGNKQMSAVYHERVYKQKPTDGNLYRAFSKYININDAKTVKYGEKFLALDNYDSIILNLNAQIYANEFTNARLGFLCNEDNRLRCGLIGAYIRLGNMTRAIELYHEIVKADPIDLSRPSYAIFEFGNNASMELRQDFETYYAKLSLKVSELTPETATVFVAATNFVQYAEIMYRGFFNE